MADVTLPGSYASVGDFTQSYTGLDPSIFKAGELARAIRRASRWVDKICRQTLYGTIDTIALARDVDPVGFYYDRGRGCLMLAPGNFPTRSVVSVQLRAGVGPVAQTVALDAAACQIMPRYIEVALNGLPGLFGLGTPGLWGGGPVYCDLTHANGWAVSTLAAPTLAAQANATLLPQPRSTTIQCFLPGTVVEFCDAFPETATVQNVNGNVVTFTANLQHDHAIDAMVMDPEFEIVTQATLLLLSDLVKTRGISPLSLRDESVDAPKSGPAKDLEMQATEMLEDFIAHA